MPSLVVLVKNNWALAQLSGQNKKYETIALVYMYVYLVVTLSYQVRPTGSYLSLFCFV